MGESGSSIAPTTRKCWSSASIRRCWSASASCPPYGEEISCQRRYVEINAWERYLVENGFRVVKLFLKISREEQRVRFLKRIDRSEKNWRFSASDVEERASWDDYQRVFSEMLTHTSTEWAPWYVIPSDHKWFARIAGGAVLVQALVEIDPHYPTVSRDARHALEEARKQLEAEAPNSGPPDPYQAKHRSR